MKKRKNIITVAIDSPAAAGAGTQARMIAKEYNLLYLDTGKIYRYIGNLKLQNKILEINKKLQNALPTIPSTLADELECNIFLKAKDLESFSKLRDLKDNF